MLYTYLWLREDGSPYYVGKGIGRRAFLHHKSQSIFRPKDKLLIFLQPWPDEATAFAYEIYLIDFWGRKDLGTGILMNHTDGGDGIAGAHHTVETKLRMRKVALGRRNSKAARTKMSEAKQGIKLSVDHCRNISKALKGRVQTEEHRQNVSAALIGVRKGIPWSPARRKAQELRQIRLKEM